MRVIIIGLISVFLIMGCETQSSKQQKNPAEIYVSLGMSYFSSGEHSLAYVKLKRALKLDPKLIDAHNAMALVKERLGMDAEKHYLTAIKLDAENPEVRNNYGTFLCRKSQIKAAEKQFILAANNPEYQTPAVAYVNAGVCVQKIRKYQKAERYFRTALDKDPLYYQGLGYLAKLHYKQQNYLSTRAFLQRYKVMRPLSANLLWLSILTEKQLGKDQEVKKYSALLKQKFPESVEIKLLKNLHEQTDAIVEKRSPTTFEDQYQRAETAAVQSSETLQVEDITAELTAKMPAKSTLLIKKIITESESTAIKLSEAQKLKVNEAIKRKGSVTLTNEDVLQFNNKQNNYKTPSIVPTLPQNSMPGLQ